MAALWESITKIEYFEEEGKCITYLNNAIKNRYLELYRQSKKQHEHEDMYSNDSINNFFIQKENFMDLIVKEDMNNLLSKYSGLKKNIFYCIIFKNMSDSEIADKFKVSRQYVNRIRKNLSRILKDYFAN